MISHLYEKSRMLIHHRADSFTTPKLNSMPWWDPIACRATRINKISRISKPSLLKVCVGAQWQSLEGHHMPRTKIVLPNPKL